jgi:N-methylhydantoinase A/oxoprolinase/acetone carboxylase beta subunit
VASATTARALRRASAQQGHDPRGAHLVAFGGAGPTLAAETADRLDLRGVVVPQHAGALAAWGTLLAPLRADASRVARRQDSAGLRKGLDELAAKVGARLAKEGATRPTLHSELDVRYVGQAFTVTVPYGAAWRRAFDEGHGRRFGFADPQRAVEVVRLRVRGLGYEGRRRRARRASATNPRWRRATPAFVKDGVGHRAREALPPGATLRGPAVVGEATATTWVPRGWTARIAAEGDLVLERES